MELRFGAGSRRASPIPRLRLTTVAFAVPGTYVLRLTASDSVLDGQRRRRRHREPGQRAAFRGRGAAAVGDVAADGAAGHGAGRRAAGGIGGDGSVVPALRPCARRPRLTGCGGDGGRLRRRGLVRLPPLRERRRADRRGHGRGGGALREHRTVRRGRRGYDDRPSRERASCCAGRWRTTLCRSARPSRSRGPLVSGPAAGGVRRAAGGGDDGPLHGPGDLRPAPARERRRALGRGPGHGGRSCRRAAAGAAPVALLRSPSPGSPAERADGHRRHGDERQPGELAARAPAAGRRRVGAVRLRHEPGRRRRARDVSTRRCC